MIKKNLKENKKKESRVFFFTKKRMYFAIFVVRVAASFTLCFSRKLRTLVVENEADCFSSDELWNGTSLVSVNRFLFRLDHRGKKGMARHLIHAMPLSRKELVNEYHLVWGFNISAIVTGTS